MEKKKSSVGGMIAATVLFSIILVMAIVVNAKYAFNLPATDINELIREEGGPVNGEFVEIEVDAALDWYAETKHYTNGIPTGKDKHCVIWLSDYEFISLTVKGKKNIEKLDKIIDETWEYLNYETDELPSKVTFKGELTTMDSEISDYFYDYAQWQGLTSENGYTVYYMTIDATTTQAGGILWILGAALIEGLIIFALIKTIKDNKEEKLAEAARLANANSTYTPSGMGEDYDRMMQGFNNDLYKPSEYEQNLNKDNNDIFK